MSLQVFCDHTANPPNLIHLVSGIESIVAQTKGGQLPYPPCQGDSLLSWRLSDDNDSQLLSVRTGVPVLE